VIFERIHPSSEYQALRFLSESGVWELGLNPYHAGTRLRMGLSGRPPSVIDFCLGYHTKIYYPVLMAVLERLRALPESASAKEIDALFPWAGTRPDLNIHLEPLLLPFS
jgi:hypothetical protein